MSAKHTLAIAPDVQTVLAAAVVGEDRITLPGQLGRGLYKRTDEVLRELGAKWSRKAGAHVFAAAKREIIAAAILGSEVRREKVVRQAYYTPDAAADALARFVDDARTGPSVYVLDPSAGEGALLSAWWRNVRCESSVRSVSAVEIDLVAVEVLRAKFSLGRIHHGDFLEFSPHVIGRHDVVLMNPPYQRGQALRHVQHALKFVRPGGVIGAIVPANFPESVDGVDFDTEALPPNSFKESGTSVRVKMLRASL